MTLEKTQSDIRGYYSLKQYTDSVDESYEETNTTELSNMSKHAPNAIANTLVPSASISAKRKASSEIEIAQAPPVKKLRTFAVQVERTVLCSYTVEAYSMDEAKQFSLYELQNGVYEYEHINEWESLTGKVDEVDFIKYP